MRRTVAVTLLVLGLALAPVVAAATPGLAGSVADAGGASSTASAAQADGSDAFSPGERLAAALGTERAELDGDVGERSFGVALSRAESSASAAGVVADRIDRIRSRLGALEERNASLAARYENGSLSRGAYAARVAVIDAERASLARQLNATRVAVVRLPADALAARDVNASAIERLRSRAHELGGPAVRDLARSIAGSGVGEEDRRGADRDEIPGLDEDGLPGERGGEEDGERPGDRGDGTDSGNGSDGDRGAGDSDGVGDGGSSGDDADRTDSGDVEHDATHENRAESGWLTR